MSTRRLAPWIALAGLALGCGSSLTPSAADSGTAVDSGAAVDSGTALDAGAAVDTGAAVDAGAAVDTGVAVDRPAPVDGAAPCMLPRGGTCARGATCPAGDGCNDCSCSLAGALMCTARPCAVDAGPAGCLRASDCGADRECRFTEAGCGMRGTCGFITDCATVQPYCDCAGQTFMACPSAPDRPWVTRAACAVDAGVADADPSPDAAICGGASIGRGGGYCAGPADGPLPLSCCTGWDCDARRVTCDRLPPPCPAGEVPLVTLGCYGACVPATRCAPMPCGSGCAGPWSCDASSMTCRYPA